METVGVRARLPLYVAVLVPVRDGMGLVVMSWDEEVVNDEFSQKKRKDIPNSLPQHEYHKHPASLHLLRGLPYKSNGDGDLV